MLTLVVVLPLTLLFSLTVAVLIQRLEDSI